MIPTVDDLKKYLERKRVVYYTQIAKRFRINVVTVSELIKPLEKDQVVSIEKVGQYKFVKLVK